MTNIFANFTALLFAILILGFDRAIAEPPIPAPKMLVGGISETWLSEARYKRITDGNGASAQGGSTPPHRVLKLDAERYKPLSCQWVGVKSLDPIPGKGRGMYFRFRIVSELYDTEEAAKRRDAEFDRSKHSFSAADVVPGTEFEEATMMPVLHFSHGRVFYFIYTDMSDSSDSNEAGKLKFSIMRHLTR